MKSGLVTTDWKRTAMRRDFDSYFVPRLPAAIPRLPFEHLRGAPPATPNRSVSNSVQLIDHHDATRRLLTRLLESIKIDVETFASPRAFLQSIPSASSNGRYCVICEIRMPEMSGLELQQELLRRNLNAQVILISEQVDIATAVRAMRAGALSVLEKPIHEQELIDLVNCHFKENAADRMLRVSNFFRAQRDLLTPRQRDVFDHLIVGQSSKEIAAQLNLSPRTVEVHRAQILKRLNVCSISHLIRLVLEKSTNAA
jgi:two-component system, LuxR family, response regulator FixJ